MFAADLARMYIRYAERHGWNVTVLDETTSDLGGYKDATLSISEQGRRRRRCLVAAEVRGRRAPRAAGSGHRVAGPRAHVGGRRARLPRTRGSRGSPDRRVRSAHRRLPVVGQGRPGRQHHRLGGAHHPPAHRHRRHLPERTLAAAEQGPRHAGARRPAAVARRGAGARPTRRPTGPARSAPSTAASGSAPTTSRRTGSPITGSTSRRTTSTRCSTATSTRCSTRWPPPTSSPGCSRHDPPAPGDRRRRGGAGRGGSRIAAHRRRTPGRPRGGHRPGSAGARRRLAQTSSTGTTDLVARARQAGPAATPHRHRGVRPGDCARRSRRVHPATGNRIDAGMGARATSCRNARSSSTCARAPVRSHWHCRSTGPTPASSPSTTPRTRSTTPGETSPGRRSNWSAPTSPTPGLLPELDGGVDLVVANPPYIPDGATLEPEVAEHDPPHALFGGPDGMTVIDAIVELAARWLRAGGRCAVEHDDTTSARTVDAFTRAARFGDVTARHDLTGRPRFVTATRRR